MVIIIPNNLTKQTRVYNRDKVHNIICNTSIPIQRILELSNIFSVSVFMTVIKIKVFFMIFFK